MGRVVTPHHIAHGVDGHLIKTTGLHPQLQGLRTRKVSGGEVAHAQFTPFGKALVAELRQPFMPVPHFFAQCGLRFASIVQAKLGDAVDLAQAFL